MVNFVSFFVIVKLIILLLIAMYGVFSFVMFNQIRTMDRIVTYKNEQWVEIIGLLHIVVVASLFLFALVIL